MTVRAVYDRAYFLSILKIGVTHFIVSAGAPFDHAGIRRFAEEIIPKYKS